MIRIKFLNGYWTVFSGAQPLMSFASYSRAVEFIA